MNYDDEVDRGLGRATCRRLGTSFFLSLGISLYVNIWARCFFGGDDIWRLAVHKKEKKLVAYHTFRYAYYALPVETFVLRITLFSSLLLAFSSYSPPLLHAQLP